MSPAMERSAVEWVYVAMPGRAGQFDVAIYGSVPGSLRGQIQRQLASRSVFHHRRTRSTVESVWPMWDGRMGANMSGQSAFGSPTPPFVTPPAKPWWKKGWVWSVAVIVVFGALPVVLEIAVVRQLLRHFE